MPNKKKNLIYIICEYLQQKYNTLNANTIIYHSELEEITSEFNSFDFNLTELLTELRKDGIIYSILIDNHNGYKVNLHNLSLLINSEIEKSTDITSIIATEMQNIYTMTYKDFEIVLKYIYSDTDDLLLTKNSINIILPRVNLSSDHVSVSILNILDSDYNSFFKYLNKITTGLNNLHYLTLNYSSDNYAIAISQLNRFMTKSLTYKNTSLTAIRKNMLLNTNINNDSIKYVFLNDQKKIIICNIEKHNQLSIHFLNNDNYENEHIYNFILDDFIVSLDELIRFFPLIAENKPPSINIDKSKSISTGIAKYILISYPIVQILIYSLFGYVLKINMTKFYAIITLVPSFIIMFLAVLLNAHYYLLIFKKYLHNLCHNSKYFYINCFLGRYKLR